MTEGQVWLNGALVPADQAVVSVFDHGLTVGDGAFETLKAIEGVPFAPRRHLERLRRSAFGLGMRIPYEDAELQAAIGLVLASHDHPLARVRVTVTGGVSPLGSERGVEGATVIVAAAPLDEPEPSIAVCTVPWPRNERGAMAGIKTTSYAENVVALSYARDRGCSEAIFATTTGLVCEGTGSNVFVVVGERFVTPSLSSGCLAGVTRDLIVELTDAVEEDVTMADLLAADEVFLTSTGRDVQPVHRVDEHRLPVPGDRTRAAATAFADLIATTFDP